MPKSDQKDIVLGVGKLLGIFFLVVVLCAISFAFGYTYGRNRGQATASAADSQTQQASIPAKPVTKPPATDRLAASCPDGENCQQPGIPSSQDLSFYNSVKKKEANSSLSAPAKPAPPAIPAQAKPAAAAKTQPQNQLVSGVMVQVAAVTKREDAEVLQEALRRKQYPVMITTAANDKLFHVQIGPFSDQKDAEVTRTRLQGEGYNPILKR